MFLIYLVAGFSGCKKENRCDCFKGTGKETTQTRNLDGFKALRILDKIDVEIKQGHVYMVEIMAGSELLNLINTEVKDSLLTIQNSNKCDWSRTYKRRIKITVTAPEFLTIIQSGTGNITSKDTLVQKDILVEVKNSGNISLLLKVSNSFLNIHGSVGDLSVGGVSGVSYVFNSGDGYLDAGNLLSDITFLSSEGTGKTMVWAKNVFEGQIHYLGDVTVKGNPPSTKLERFGKGNFIFSN